MWVIGILISYVIGSLPFGYWIAKKVKHIDIRTVGSGNPGTANIGRVLGAKYALVTLGLDTFKGLLPVWILPWLFAGPSGWFPVCLAMAAVMGHTRSVFLHFQGGKAVATGLGTLLGLAFPVALLAALIFGLGVWFTRYVSVGSMVAALTVPLWLYLFRQPWPYLLYGSALAIYILWRHRLNLERLRRGEEPQVQFFPEEETQEPSPN